jgi:membrane-associated phospholipid phosphatase
LLSRKELRTSARLFITSDLQNPTMLSGDWDREVLLTLNSLAGSDTLYVWDLANDSLFRGAPIFFALVALWFSGDCGKRRSRMLSGLSAVCLATVLSLWLQFHAATHTRPILDPALHIRIVNPQWTPEWGLVWDRTNSFPSDTATMYFALATVISLENGLVGLFCFVWATAIAIPRVIFGWHYPSDIVGSLILAVGCVFLFNKMPYPRMLFERTLIFFAERMYIVHALLFIFLLDASNLFGGLEQLGRHLARMLP